MSIHIGAKKGDIADMVLLPGDPLRAKFVAENYLQDAFCYNEVRGMYGYTGTYQGKRVSVQGTGMGQPSHAIYVNELIRDFGAKKLIRIGSCGSYQKDVKIRDVVIAMSSATDSSLNQMRFKGMAYAPTADFSLLLKAYNKAKEIGVDPKVGQIMSSDHFYDDNPDLWKMWADYGVLAVEMETAALYTVAAQFGVQALSLLTVSDSLVTGEATTSEERQNTFTTMMEIALSLAENG